VSSSTPKPKLWWNAGPKSGAESSRIHPSSD
jgi:hypothetical protein